MMKKEPGNMDFNDNKGACELECVPVFKNFNDNKGVW